MVRLTRSVRSSSGNRNSTENGVMLNLESIRKLRHQAKKLSIPAGFTSLLSWFQICLHKTISHFLIIHPFEWGNL
jgi:hypothetical protein